MPDCATCAWGDECTALPCECPGYEPSEAVDDGDYDEVAKAKESEANDENA